MQQDAMSTDDSTIPLCPKCKTPMVERQGPWSKFWGCSRFPSCDGRLNKPKKESPIPSMDEFTAEAMIALAFVKKVGGFNRARHWIDLAERIADLANKPRVIPTVTTEDSTDNPPEEIVSDDGPPF